MCELLWWAQIRGNKNGHNKNGERMKENETFRSPVPMHQLVKAYRGRSGAAPKIFFYKHQMDVNA
jgi:hypothetical protein